MAETNLSQIAEYFKGAQSLGAVALIVGLLGVFRERILKRFYRPKMQLIADLAPPDCHKTQIRYPSGSMGECYYLRFRLENFGNEDATDLEVMITGVERKNNVGEFEVFKEFLPQNLKWSNINEVSMKRIPPGVFKNLDFGSIRLRSQELESLLTEEQRDRRVSQFFLIDTHIFPLNGAGIWLPGQYRLQLAVSCKETGTFKRECFFEFPELWHQDEFAAFIDIQFGITGQPTRPKARRVS